MRNLCATIVTFCSKTSGHYPHMYRKGQKAGQGGEFHIGHKIFFLGISCDSTRQTETSVFATGQAVWSKYIINLPHTSQQGPVMKLKKYESLKISSPCLVMSERVYSSWRSCSSSSPPSSGVSAERLWIPWEESSSMISSSDMLITDTRWRGGDWLINKVHSMGKRQPLYRKSWYIVGDRK